MMTHFFAHIIFCIFLPIYVHERREGRRQRELEGELGEKIGGGDGKNHLENLEKKVFLRILAGVCLSSISSIINALRLAKKMKFLKAKKRRPSTPLTPPVRFSEEFS
jgi:hypothetical protein